MPQETVEQLFMRFRNQSDPQALAAVFDRTAPELLRVALHLAGNPIDAEDLLQETFASVIATAHSWDQARELLPWLLGVLANRGRRWRRRERRAVLPERLVPRPALDPSRAAADAELVSVLEEKVAHLPEHYRSVLVLYVKHGLAPTEIADALRRSPATVRSQLLRGLELLRKALPPSLAGILVTWIATSRGLAAVREAVLGNVTSAVGAKAFFLGLSLNLSKVIVMVLAAVFSAGLAWIAWPGASAVAFPVAQLDPATAAPDTVAENEPAAPPLARAPVLEPQQGAGSLLVRVNVGEDGSPSAQVGVQVRPLDLPDALLRDRWYVTRADGSMLVAGLEPGRHEVTLDRAGGRKCEVKSGKATELDLVIPKGIDVAGVVVDELGAAVADATVWLGSEEGSDAGHEVARSAADGSFHVRAVPDGRVVTAYGRAHGVATLQKISGTPGEKVNARLRTVRTEAFVSGIVCDAAGNPREDATVMVGVTGAHREADQKGFGGWRFAGGVVPAESLGDSLQPRWTRTNAAGFFKVDGLFQHENVSGSKQRVWISAPGCERRLLTTDIPRKGVDLGVVRLDSAASLSGRLLDSQGVPVRDQAMRVEEFVPYRELLGPRTALQGPPSWVSSEVATGADGRFVLSGLCTGELTLFCYREEHIALWTTLTFAAGESRKLDLTLSASQEINGVLVDARDVPLGNFELIATPSSNYRLERTATADEAGRFTISGCFDLAYALQVRDPGCSIRRPIEAIATLRPGAKEQRVRVPDGVLAAAEISGLVRDASGQPIHGARISVSRRDFYNEGGPSTQSAATGAFQVPSLPAGKYAISVGARGYPSANLQIELGPRQRLELPPIQLADPGFLTGTVTDLEGKPFAYAVSGLLSPAGTGGATVQVKDGNVVEPCAVLPGKYLWRVAGAAPGGGRQLAEAWVEIRAGKETKVELELKPAARRALVIRRVESEPRVDWVMRLRDGQGKLVWSSRGQFDRMIPSRFELEYCFFPGTWAVEVEDQLQRRASATFTIEDPASTAPPIDLLLR